MLTSDITLPTRMGGSLCSGQGAVVPSADERNFFEGSEDRTKVEDSVKAMCHATIDECTSHGTSFVFRTILNEESTTED